MNAYRGNRDEDLLLAQWWAVMERDGDLPLMWGRNMRTLGAMLAFFQNPARALIYEYDERGIWFAMWFDPVMDHTVVALWVRIDRRYRPSTLKAFNAGYEIAFSKWDVILGLTRRDLLAAHQRFGYRVVGRIPRARDGEDGWLVTLTKAWWEAAQAARASRRKVVA